MKFLIRPVKKSDANSWERLRNLLWEGDNHKSEIALFFRGEAEEPNEVLLAVRDPLNKSALIADNAIS